MKDTDLVYELRRIDKNYSRYWANAELLEVTDAAADYIEALESSLYASVVMPELRDCQCNSPIIICDNRGCHCERCGLPERIDWGAIVNQQEKAINEALSVPSTNHCCLNEDVQPHPNDGSGLEDFLNEDGTLDETTKTALKRVSDFLDKLENGDNKEGFLGTELEDSEQWTEVYQKGGSSFKTVDLPQEEWHICSTCNGNGSYLEEGDLHRSTGWVPCYNCSNGWIKTKKLWLIQKKQNDENHEKPWKNKKLNLENGKWVLT